MKNFKLCYIDKDNTAYFTTQDLNTQWGDDWDDRPYEHNAGIPYSPLKHYHTDGSSTKVHDDWNEDGTPKWELYKLKFESDILEKPSDYHWNSPYSVRDINAGVVAWLRGELSDHTMIVIHAGTSIDEFKSKVRQAGGTIYVPEE